MSGDVDKSLFPNIDEHIAAGEARAAQAYDTKILRVVLEAMFERDRMKEIEREAGDEFGFFWFNANFPCPITLRTSKVKVVPVHLIKSAGMTKTPLWQEYFGIKSEYAPETMLGVVFRIPNVGQYVIHNYSAISLEPGHNTVVRQANNPDKALYITPLKAFLIGLKKVW